MKTIKSTINDAVMQIFLRSHNPKKCEVISVDDSGGWTTCLTVGEAVERFGDIFVDHYEMYVEGTDLYLTLFVRCKE